MSSDTLMSTKNQLVSCISNSIFLQIDTDTDNIIDNVLSKLCVDDKITIKSPINEMKRFIVENNIVLPKNGSGKNGVFIKKDYIEILMRENIIERPKGLDIPIKTSFRECDPYADSTTKSI